MFQMSSEIPDFGLAPETGWVHSSLVMCVPDTDAVVDRAVSAGGTRRTPVSAPDPRPDMDNDRPTPRPVIGTAS